MSFIKIRKVVSDPWLEISADVVEHAVSGNALDSDTSGRDNSTGKMFRDLICIKQKPEFKVHETTQLQGAAIADIVLSPEFQMSYPSPLSGSYVEKMMYLATLSIPIKSFNEDGTWTNGEFTISPTEM